MLACINLLHHVVRYISRYTLTVLEIILEILCMEEVPIIPNIILE